MCKIAVIPHINNDNRQNVIRLIKALAVQMSEKDDHGFGYTAMNTEGKLFGERWLKNNKAFKSREAVSPLDRVILETYMGILDKGEEYNSFGEVDLNKMTAITLHARFATQGVRTLRNTHPFVIGNTSLIHNGIVYNHRTLNLNEISDCDSEAILQLYLKHSVNESLRSVEDVADRINGYFACGVFSVDKAGTPILDIIRDDSASLHAGYVKQIGGIVFVTSIENLRKACKRLKFTLSSTYNVKPNFAIRFNALTGKPIERVHFENTYTYSYAGYGNYGGRHVEGTGVSTGSSTGTRLVGTPSLWDHLRQVDDKDHKDWSWDQKKKVWRKMNRAVNGGME